jgi:hypothetical protein
MVEADVMKDFSSQIADFAKKAKNSMDEQVRGITFALFSSVINSTPVGNRELWAANQARKERGLPPLPKGYAGGRLRNNWAVSIGAPADSPDAPPDPSGQASLEELSKIGGAGTVTFMSNSLPYALPVEYGHSKQSPAGMVRVNLARIEQIIDEVSNK